MVVRQIGDVVHLTTVLACVSITRVDVDATELDGFLKALECSQKANDCRDFDDEGW